MIGMMPVAAIRIIEITVAHAAPAKPQSSPNIKIGSKMALPAAIASVVFIARRASP